MASALGRRDGTPEAEVSHHTQQAFQWGGCTNEPPDVPVQVRSLTSMIALAIFTDQTEEKMASITIRNLEEELKQSLRVQAAVHGRSMEEEAREILRRAIRQQQPRRDLGKAIRARFEGLSGADIVLPERTQARDVPSFE